VATAFLNVTPTALTFTGVVHGTTNVNTNRYGELIPANPLEWNAARGFGGGQHCRKR
jgi:hypothetical protein